MGQTPVLRELLMQLSHERLSGISGFTLESELLMMEQERAFKGPDVVRPSLRESLGKQSLLPPIV